MAKRPKTKKTTENQTSDMKEIAEKAKKVFLRNVILKVREGKTLTAHEAKVYDEFVSAEGESDRRFKNAKEIATYLRGEGWKVSQATEYNHQHDGKIKADKDGMFPIKNVLTYARNFLVLKEIKTKLDDYKLHRKKLEAETLKLREQAKLAQIKRMAEEKRYILRSDFELELAARAVTIEANLKFMVQDRAPDWIRLMEGNYQMMPELVRQVHDDLDIILNEFASAKEFTVTIGNAS